MDVIDTEAAVEESRATGRPSGSLPMVRFDHGSKTYPRGTAPAVNDLSFEIEDGQVFTLLGPSGCGKTTTLRMIAGLETMDSGALYFRDKPIVDTSRNLFVPPHRRHVGMVFQSYAIWPHMTVFENVAFPLAVRRIPRAEAQTRVAKVLELVGLTGYEKRPAPMLSGGQQQRVALARALVHEPTVLLLDEPFSNLDAKLREQMRLEVKLLQRKTGVTVVFVTHDQVEALSLSDRVAVLDEGVLQQVGSPRQLYDEPANAFVRDFLGKTVLLSGKVKIANAGGQVAVEVDGAPGCIVFGRNYVPDSLAVGLAVHMALRPEDLNLIVDTGQKAPEGGVKGRIETQLFIGERTEYRVRLEQQPPILVYGERKQALPDNQDVWVRIAPETMTVWAAA